MAKFQITAPDGSSYEITAPDGATEDQVLSYAQQNFKPSQETPTESGRTIPQELARQAGLTARYGIKGLSSIPNAVADFGAGAFNAAANLADSEKRLPYLSQVQEQGLQQVFPSPETPLEKNVQTATEAVAGMKIPGMKAPVLSANAPEVAQVPNALARRAGAEAAAVSAGAVAGENATQAAQDYTGSPLAGLAAGLATGTIAGSGTGKFISSMTGPRTQPVTIQDVRNRAKQGYTAMEDAGVAINKQSLDKNLFPAIDRAMRAEKLNPDLVSAHKPIAEELASARQALGNPFTPFTTLEQVRSNFSTLAKNDDNTGRIAKQVVNEIDSYLGGINPKDTISVQGKTTAQAMDALKSARTDWRNQSRAQVLQDIMDSAAAKAEGSTGPTGDILKRKLVNLTANVDQMKMFNTREQNVIKAAAKATDLETMLSIFAKFNPERGAMQSAMTMGAVSRYDTVPGMVGMGMSASGYAADKALESVRNREVKNLISQIASGNLQAPKEGFAVPGLFGAIQGSK
jgi:hypothetical protein